MYRDSRPSIEARVRELDRDLDGARDELSAREDSIPPLALQLFPLFNNLAHTTESLDRGAWVSRLTVLGMLAVMSVAALPLALAWRPLRGDVRGLRTARRRVRRLEGQLAEARRTLLALGDGS